MGEHYLKDELYELIRSDSAIFEFLQRGALDGLWYWDVTDPEQEWMNTAFKELFGYADEEIPDTSEWWQQNIHPDDLKTALENFDAHLKDPSHAYDQVVRYRHKDGSTVWVRCRGIAIRDDDGKPTRMLGAHTDVTELMQARAELERRAEVLAQAERRFRTLFEEAPIGMAIVSLDGVIESANDRFAQIVGRTHEQVTGVTFQELTHPADVDADIRQARQLRAQEIERYSMEKRYLLPDGTPVWVELHGSLVTDAQGEPVHFIAQVEEIEHRRRAHEELKRLAQEDALTGLLNRRAFAADLDAHHARCARYGPKGALIALDLDDFKAVNDTRGHLAGDEALRAVATALRGRLRESDTVGRIGGDEFAVLLPEQDVETAIAVAEELERILADALIEHSAAPDRPLRASVGAAGWRAETESAAEVLAVADRVMFERKRRRTTGVGPDARDSD